MSARHGLNDKTVGQIHRVLEQSPELERAVLFGSRAKGNFKPGSDIDLALFGSALTQRAINRLYEKLDDLPIPYSFSLVFGDKITDPDVIAHIGRVGVIFYEKAGAPARLGASD